MSDTTTRSPAWDRTFHVETHGPAGAVPTNVGEVRARAAAVAEEDYSTFDGAVINGMANTLVAVIDYYEGVLAGEHES